MAGADGDDGSHDGDDGRAAARRLRDRRPARARPLARVRDPRRGGARPLGGGVDDRLGRPPGAAPGQGDRRGAGGAARRGARPRAVHGLADVVERTGLAEEVIERLIRAGGAGLAGPAAAGAAVAAARGGGGVEGAGRRPDGAGSPARARAAGRPMDLRLPATEAPPLPAITEPERLGDAYAVVGLDARRQAVSLFRDGAGPARGGPERGAGRARGRGRCGIGGLVVTRQHPMTARGTVFLALEDETGMVNVTLWPDTWQRLRSVVRRHALLLVDGDLQREANVVNVIARRPAAGRGRCVGGRRHPRRRQIGRRGCAAGLGPRSRRSSVERQLSARAGRVDSAARSALHGRPALPRVGATRDDGTLSGESGPSARGRLAARLRGLPGLARRWFAPVRVGEVEEPLYQAEPRRKQRAPTGATAHALAMQRLRIVGAGAQRVPVGAGRIAREAGRRHHAEGEAPEPRGARRRETRRGRPARGRRASTNSCTPGTRCSRRCRDCFPASGSARCRRLDELVGGDDEGDRAGDGAPSAPSTPSG